MANKPEQPKEIFTCTEPGCEGYETTSKAAYKTHMTRRHGGFIDDQKKEETHNEAQGIHGDTSIDDIISSAPANESDWQATVEPPPATKKTAASARGGKKKQEDEERKQKIQRLGVVLCRWVATIPYQAWAAAMHDPTLALTDEEAQTATALYMDLCNAVDIQFNSVWYVLVAIVILNVGFMAKRMPAVQKLWESKAEQPQQEAKWKCEFCQTENPHSDTNGVCTTCFRCGRPRTSFTGVQ